MRADAAHLLLGLLAIDDGLACKALTDMGVPPAVLRHEVADEITSKGVRQTESNEAGDPATVVGILDRAVQEARTLGHNRVTSGHMLIGLVDHERCPEAQLLARHGIDPPRIRRKIVELIRTS
ncbi:Clp protease N-terminal domain-containing protein [Actinopolymorpha sp. B11F2]|uniref:Clp protease N-terminal domain-containing protein n=1 Tax=Actinopolymorpha sp. B11F2 TaxID=3160862 RepID=UPI0032E50D14